MSATASAAPLSLAAFSADVEDYFQAESLRAFCPRERWGSLEDRTERNVDRLLALLDARGVRGTFFVLGWTAERHPDMVRRIARAGHEIASHGESHELIYRMSPEAFREDVRRSRERLRELSGQPVSGYRAPSYTIVARTRWALRILAEEGYRYDSSIFPIRRRKYGIPDAPRFPHRLPEGEDLPLVEFPLPTFRVGPLALPATGGAYLRLWPWWVQRYAVGGLVRRGLPFVVNVHPWELDPDQPRFPVNPRTRWTHYHGLSRTASVLERLFALTTYRPMIEVLEHLGLLQRNRSADPPAPPGRVPRP